MTWLRNIALIHRQWSRCAFGSADTRHTYKWEYLLPAGAAMLLLPNTNKCCAYLFWQDARCTTCSVDNNAQSLESDTLFAFRTVHICHLPQHFIIMIFSLRSGRCCCLALLGCCTIVPHAHCPCIERHAPQHTISTWHIPNNAKEEPEVMAFNPLFSVSLWFMDLFVCAWTLNNKKRRKQIAKGQLWCSWATECCVRAVNTFRFIHFCFHSTTRYRLLCYSYVPNVRLVRRKVAKVPSQSQLQSFDKNQTSNQTDPTSTGEVFFSQIDKIAFVAMHFD